MSKIIDEIKEITGNAVAKKNDTAKLNFPKLIEKIRNQAEFGKSSCTFTTYEVNEFDKKLLEQEGFKVWLTDAKLNDYYKQSTMGQVTKVWEVLW